MHLAVQRRQARSTAVGGDLIAEQSVETVHTAQQQPLLLVKHRAHFHQHAPVLLVIAHPLSPKRKKSHRLLPSKEMSEALKLTHWPAMSEA
jgi:hypothetical protein